MTIYILFLFIHSCGTGEMAEAFIILTDSMYKKGDQQLLSYGKYSQSYKGGADE